MKNISKKLNPWYVTGFCEGEVAFTFSRYENVIRSLYFGIKLTRADQDLIYKLHNFFGAGRIFKVKSRRPDSRIHSGWSKPALYFRITDTEGLKKVIKHFDEYPPQGLKAESYKIWREMFFVLKIKKPVNYEKLERLAEKLSAASPRNQPWTEE